MLTAEKEQWKIAVEIKSFIGPSEMHDLENAIGQFVIYSDMLEEVEPDRLLYLAVSSAAYVNLFEEPLGKKLIRKRGIKLIVFNVLTEVIEQWKD